MARPPLAKGDDGSGNRYPVWIHCSTCGRNHRENDCPARERCPICNGPVYDNGTRPCCDDPHCGWAAPINKAHESMWEPAYTLRFEIDGDELELPFTAYEGKHYRLGEPLALFAEKMVDDLGRTYHDATSLRVTIYPPLEKCGCNPLCTNEWEPEPVFDMAIERDPDGFRG